jgi:hypothetical protein
VGVRLEFHSLAVALFHNSENDALSSIEQWEVIAGSLFGIAAIVIFDSMRTAHPADGQP